MLCISTANYVLVSKRWKQKIKTKTIQVCVQLPILFTLWLWFTHKILASMMNITVEWSLVQLTIKILFPGLIYFTWQFHFPVICLHSLDWSLDSCRLVVQNLTSVTIFPHPSYGRELKLFSKLTTQCLNRLVIQTPQLWFFAL